MNELPNLLTQGGTALVVMLLIGVIRSAMPKFDAPRWGSLVAIGLGIALVAFSNLTAVADIRLEPVGVLLTGLLGGAAASGIYDAGQGIQRR